MRYHLFLHYGRFLQNLGKDFIQTTTVGVSDFAIKDFLSHGISIPIWPSIKVTILYSKFKKKLVKMLCQNC